MATTNTFIRIVLLFFVVALIAVIIINAASILQRPEIAVQMVDYFGFPPVYASDINCPGKNCNEFAINFIVANEQLCWSNEIVFLVILVTSAPGNIRQRDAIRRTWATNGRDVVTAFVVGVPDHGLHHSYEEEMRQNDDMIITQVTESYRNLTAKTAHLLKWADQHCKSAKYIMKTDDDSLNFPQNIVNYLKDQDYTKDLLIGECASGIRPYRDRKNKWYISKEEYSGSFFPLYLRGRGYIMTRSTVKKLLATSPQVVANSMEDIFWTGFCRWKANVQVDCSKNFAITDENHLVPRCTIIQKDLFNVHHVKYQQFELYWSWFKDKAKGKLNDKSDKCEIDDPEDPILRHFVFIALVLIFAAILIVLVRTKLK